MEFEKPTKHPVHETKSFKQVCLGNYFSLALTDNDKIYYWGMFDNEFYLQA